MRLANDRRISYRTICTLKWNKQKKLSNGIREREHTSIQRILFGDINGG